MALSLGPLDPVLAEAFRDWWKRFEPPVSHEEDGSVSVGRGDAAVKAWREFERQQMQTFLAWDFGSQDMTAEIVRPPRSSPGCDLIPINKPLLPRDTGPLRGGPADIRLYKTWAFQYPYLPCSCGVPSDHPEAANKRPSGPHARDCAFVTGERPDPDPAVTYAFGEKEKC